jgi:predicted permease
MEIGFNRVGPAFFETMKMPLVRGRSFTEADGEGAADVVVVNQRFAEQYWPGQDPIGKRLSIIDDRWMEVVGVSRNAKYRTLGEEPRAFIYVPLYQHYQPSATFLVRATSNASGIPQIAKAEIGAIDKALPIFDVKTGMEHLEFALLPARIAGGLLGVLGAIALMLAAIGIYGVMSFAVVQRTREMGIRIALGAGRTNVLQLVIGQGMRLALVGMAVGIGVAAAVTRFASMFLYGISPTDPLTFTAISGILGLVAFMACYVPARRATRVDPIVALRAD